MIEFLREAIIDVYVEIFGEIPPDEIIDCDIEEIMSGMNEEKAL